MKTYVAQIILDAHAQLGEGVLWDERTSRLWWVDITQGHLHRLTPVTGVNETFVVAESVGSVILEDAESVLITTRNCFARFNPMVQKVEVLSTIEHKNVSVRFNDGKCDPGGRFWAGTLAEDGSSGAGDLYTFENEKTVTHKIGGIGISNGIGWSPECDTMYYIDSPSQKVVAFVYDVKTGQITAPRTVIHIDEKMGTPDGMTVDSEGMLWVALWGGGKVIRVSPLNGEVIGEVIVPGVTNVTSCTFGGSDMTTLFISTARQGLTNDELIKQPHAGGLFVAKINVRGVIAFRYKER